MNQVLRPILASILSGICALLVPEANAGHPPSLWEDWELHEEVWLDAPKWEGPDAFRQLDEILPTPTDVRLASGAPGPGYWQQKVDYAIDKIEEVETFLKQRTEDSTPMDETLQQMLSLFSDSL